jgi:hypothetical protein
MTRHFRLETSDGMTVVTFSDAKVVPETTDPFHGRVEDEGHRRLLAAVGRWRPGGLEPDLNELQRITVLDRIFETYASGEDALHDL